MLPHLKSCIIKLPGIRRIEFFSCQQAQIIKAIRQLQMRLETEKFGDLSP